MLTATVTETRIAALESIIELGLQTFVEVGRALQEINESRLYREQGHATFEDYCQKRWGWKRRIAYYYIQAAEVAENVQLIAQTEPSLTQAVQLASLPEEQQRELAQHVDFESTSVSDLKAIVRDVKAGIAPEMAVHFSSESEEWYTPPEVIARVVETLGVIDLDPCSDSSETVPSTVRFTKETNGLEQPWQGRVYMNPPYGRGISAWTEKLCREYATGKVSEAIALVPARVDTDWFRMFRDFAVCFIDGRLKFSGHDNSAPFPSAVIYLGGSLAKFELAFKDLGDTWVRWRG